MLTADHQINHQSDKPNFSSPNLVFIDSQIQDYQFLISGIYQGIDVVVIPQNQDGIEIITATLEKYTNSYKKLDAIHIFSHGSPGSIKLGDIFLNTHTLKLYQNQIQKWRKALKTTADILLYGCNVAAGIGQAFVNQLQKLTKANIAASVNPTGAYPGDWNLEFTTGKITAPQVLKPETMAGYNGTLATITVTNNNDSGAGSLREAIADANPGDIIEFDSSLANQTITLTSGQLEIDKDLTIDGGNAENLTISGDEKYRVLYQENDLNFTIKNIRIADGYTTDRGGGLYTRLRATLTVENVDFENNKAGEGGAITVYHFSQATITDSTFNNNDGTLTDSEQGGGAIHFRDVEAVVINSEFTNNKGINGGGINSLASWLTVENSRFINNDTTSRATVTGGFGGGVYTDGLRVTFNDGTEIGGTARVNNSYFEGNTAAGDGGGAYFFGYNTDQVLLQNTIFTQNTVIEDRRGKAYGGGVRTGNISIVTIENTTFTENLSHNSGGGLSVDAKSSQVNITNSTFSENRAANPNTDDGIGGAITIQSPTNITNTTIANNTSKSIGGGIFSWDPDNVIPITVKNTIFANNNSEDTRDFKHHSSRQLINGGNNLQFPGPTTHSADTTVTDNILIEDPMLGNFSDSLFIYPLLSGSPAIDAGTNTNAPTTDQLGKTRPVDGDNNGSSITDIGAIEFIPTSEPENCITGDNSDNLLNGTSDDDCIHGLGGNDTLKGLAGKDTIDGGDGNDTLGGGAGNDLLNGEAGNDYLSGWIGNDIIDGGDGFDILQGGDDADTLNGGGDADTLKGGTGNDLLNGDTGNDFIQGQAGADELNGGDGKDTIGGGNGNDIVNGNAGNDLLTGWIGNDIINGGDGLDTLQGGDNADTLNGGGDADTLKGGTGNDFLNGDTGDDFIQGQAGNDELNGGDGKDTVGGGNGNDIVNGNAGNDSLTGWWGDDTLTGGTGNDIVQGGGGLDILNGEQGTDTLTGGSNSDRFIFDIGNQFNLTDIGSDIIKDFNSAELDKIVLSKTTFTSLDSVVGDGFSAAGEFAVVDNDAAVATSSAEIVYNSANGQLFYNPNGATSGFGDGGLFATLENQANLQAEDFVLTS